MGREDLCYCVPVWWERVIEAEKAACQVPLPAESADCLLADR